MRSRVVMLALIVLVASAFASRAQPAEAQKHDASPWGIA
jgi:uncharacterized membrane protein YadS